jgi:hypothetical protein
MNFVLVFLSLGLVATLLGSHSYGHLGSQEILRLKVIGFCVAVLALGFALWNIKKKIPFASWYAKGGTYITFSSDHVSLLDKYDIPWGSIEFVSLALVGGVKMFKSYLVIGLSKDYKPTGPSASRCDDLCKFNELISRRYGLESKSILTIALSVTQLDRLSIPNDEIVRSAESYRMAAGGLRSSRPMKMTPLDRIF